VGKYTKILVGWLAIIPIAFLVMNIVYANIPGGDGTFQIIFAGIYFNAFMIWLLIVVVDEKLQMILNKLSIPEKSSHE